MSLDKIQQVWKTMPVIARRFTLSTPQDYAELLEKVDKLCKLVAEKEASGKFEKNSSDMISLNLSFPRSFTRTSIHWNGSRLQGIEENSGGGGIRPVTESGSFDVFYPSQIFSSQIRDIHYSARACGSMGFPFASSSKKLSEDLPWGSDFSSTNLFACDNYVRGFSSTVSVTATLGTRSCAWCGLGGRDVKAIKELKVCTACQSTYYCSSEC